MRIFSHRRRQKLSVDYSFQPGRVTTASMRVPEKYQYPRDATSVWNGPNHRHLCNHCRCFFCTALRWVVLPHCKCKLPSVRLGLTLDARLRAKRRLCRHLPRHKTSSFYDCLCVDFGHGWRAIRHVQDCDLSKGNPTGLLPSEDKFIDSTTSFRTA